MNFTQFMAVGLRILGIYVIVRATEFSWNLYQMIRFDQSHGIPNSGFFFIVSFLLMALVFTISFILFKFPVAIAKVFLPKRSDGEILWKGNPKDIQTAMFCGIGVFLLAISVPDLLYDLLWLFEFGFDYGLKESKEMVIDAITAFVKIGIGLFLSLRSTGLSVALWRMRHQRPPEFWRRQSEE